MATVRFSALAQATHLYLESYAQDGSDDPIETGYYPITKRVGTVAEATVTGLVGEFYGGAKKDLGGGNWSHPLGYLQRVDMVDEDVLIDLVARNVSGLTGPNLVSITVKDEETSELIGAARVLLSRPGESASKRTGANRVAEFAADDATWTVTVAAAGYAGHAQQLVVDGETTADVLLDPITIPVSTDPNLCEVTVFVRDMLGELVDGAYVVLEYVGPAALNDAVVIGNQLRSKTVDGVVSFSLLRTGVYSIKVSKAGMSSQTWTYAVPASASAIASTVI